MSKAWYYTKYTAGSYLDLLASIPISTAEAITRVSKKILKDKTPNFLDAESLQNSEILKARTKLRESLDTKPGVSFIQSNIIGAIPFFLIGMPAAEAADSFIESNLSEIPLMAKYALNSTATLGAQMLTGYTAFMANEVRTNFEKYSENGRLKPSKVGKGFANLVKAFLSFDIPYVGAKLGGQSYFLATGRDPWVASSFFDSLALPIWYTLSIPIGLSKGIIETKDTRQKESPLAEIIDNNNP